MANEREVIVDGFAFHTRREAEKAQKELDGIKYLKSKMTDQDPDKKLQLYHKIISQGLFETPVGLHYVKELQEELKTVPYLMEDAIEPIDVPAGTGLRNESLEPKESSDSKKKLGGRQKKEDRKIEKQTDTHGKGIPISIVINVILAVIVVAMFAISMTSDNINIINYENEIIDKYEAWEQELQEREQAVEEAESQLEQ